MSKRNHSYTYYQVIELFPVIFCAIVTFIVVFSLYLYQFLSRRCSIKGAAKSVNKSMFKWLTKLIKIVFGPPVGLVHDKPHEDEELDGDNVPVIYIHKEKVPKSVVLMLGSYVVLFFIFSFTVFLQLFLLELSSECDDTTIDCFANNDSTSDSFVPIDNCEVYEGYGSNVTIICYDFSFSFGPALGAAGGLLPMIKLVMKAISVFFLNIYEKFKIKNKSSRFLCTVLFQYLLIFALFIGGEAGVVYLTIGISTSTNYSNVLQFCLIFLTLCMGLGIPWSKFIKHDPPSDSVNLIPIKDLNVKDYGTSTPA